MDMHVAFVHFGYICYTLLGFKKIAIIQVRMQWNSFVINS